MTTPGKPAPAGDAYAFARAMARGQLDRDAAAVEARAVIDMKRAVMDPRRLGGIVAALQIATDAVEELEAIAHRRLSYREPDLPEPASPDPLAEAFAFAQEVTRGGWRPDRTLRRRLLSAAIDCPRNLTVVTP